MGSSFSSRSIVVPEPIILQRKDEQEELWRHLSNAKSSSASGATSPGQSLLASILPDLKASLSSVYRPLKVLLKGSDGVVVGSAYSADGSMMAVCDHLGTLKVWHVDSGRCRAELLRGGGPHEEDCRPTIPRLQTRSISFSPDGTLLAAGCSDRSVRIWELNPIGGAAAAAVLHVAAMTRTDSSTSSYSSLSNRARSSASSIGSSRSCPSSVASGTSASSWTQDRSNSWGRSSGGRLKQSGPGSFSSTLSGSLGKSRMSRVASLPKRQPQSPCLVIWPGASGCRSLARSPADVLRAGAADATASAFVDRGDLRSDCSDPGVTCVAFSPCGMLLAVGMDDGLAAVWDLTARRLGAAACVAVLQGHTDGGVTAAAFAPHPAHVVADGRLATAGVDGRISVWDGIPAGGQSAAIGKGAEAATSRMGAAAGSGGLRCKALPRCVAQLHGHDGSVLCLSFGTNATQLATGGADGTARVWEIEDGVCQPGLVGGHAVSAPAPASPDEGRPGAPLDLPSCEHRYQSSATREAIGRDAGPLYCGKGPAEVLPPRAGPAGVLPPRAGPAGVLPPCLPSLTSPVNQSEAPLSWRCSAVLEGHLGGVTSVTFGGEGGRALATGGEDGGARLWHLTAKSKCVGFVQGIQEGSSVGMATVVFETGGGRLHSKD